MARLEDVAYILDSQRVPITKADRLPGPYPYYGANGLQDKINNYIFDDELVLLAEDGGNFDAEDDRPIAYRVSGKCWVNNHAHVLKPKDGVDVDYLCYSLMNYDVSRIVNGATRKKLTQADMREMIIPLPDLPTQRRIAATLDKVSEGIDLCRKMLADLDELVKSQFIEMFGDAEHTAYEVSTVGKECTLKSGTTFSSDVEQTEGEYKYAKVSDMNLPGNEVYIKSSKAYVSTDTAGKTPIPAGAVIFPKRGGAIGTNKKRILVEDTCVDLNTMGVIPGARIITEYLYGFFNGMDLMSIADGSTIPQLNNRQIAPLALVVPPLEAQKQFAEFFNQGDKSKFAIQQQLSALETLKKSLMQEYFG